MWDKQNGSCIEKTTTCDLCSLASQFVLVRNQFQKTKGLWPVNCEPSSLRHCKLRAAIWKAWVIKKEAERSVKYRKTRINADWEANVRKTCFEKGNHIEKGTRHKTRADLVWQWRVHFHLDFSQTTLSSFYSLWQKKKPNSSALHSMNKCFSLCFINFFFPSLVNISIGFGVVSKVI